MVSVSDVPGAQELSKDQLRELYYKMFLARSVGERERMLNRMGKGPFAVTGEGHEATQVGTAYAMTPGKDWALTYYRDLGVALTLGMTPRDLLLAHLARAESIESGGRNMPSHFSSVDLHIVSGSAPVATQVPHAVGIALASKLRGLDEVAVAYFGDGGASVGDVHESMNFAGVHSLAVIFVCENNQYAISVPASKQAAIADLSIRAQGYGFPGVTVDGNDVLAVYGAARGGRRRVHSSASAPGWTRTAAPQRARSTRSSRKRWPRSTRRQSTPRRRRRPTRHRRCGTCSWRRSSDAGEDDGRGGPRRAVR